MANYYPLLSGIIAVLENSSAEFRRRIYENARTGFLEQMRKHDPPLTDSHITQEQIAFEEAIRRVEAEQMGRNRAIVSQCRGQLMVDRKAYVDRP
jgi:hypothetical protein